MPISPERLRDALADRYTVEGELGSGGMATVFLARDLKHQRAVAIKVMKPEIATTLGTGRFLREIEIAAHFQHPHILTLLESGNADGILYYVMPFVEGETLSTRLERERQLSVEDAITISREVASALHYAHGRGVIHRDIKPDNIMLTGGHAVVMDFGIGKAIDAAAVDRFTATGLAIGTPAYMSPEQAAGAADVDERTDVYALGCILYEMLAGEPPYTGPTVQSIIAKMMADPVPSVRRLRHVVPPELDAAIQRALAKIPADRFASAAAFAESLSAPAASGARMPKRNLTGLLRGRRAWLAIAVAGFVTAGAVYIITGKPSPTPLGDLQLSRITFDAGLQSGPTWSPDARFIAYVSDRSGNMDLWVQQIEGGDPVQVTSAPEHDWQPDWSPDGNLLVYRSESPQGGGLFVVPAFGGQPRRLSTFGYRPKWSPDGVRVLFFSANTEDIVAPPRLYVIAASGEPAPSPIIQQVIAEFSGRVRASWHPDGDRVSIWGEHRTDGLSFWTTPVDGGESNVSKISDAVRRRLAATGVDLFTFMWSASGDRLYFEGVANGVRNLWKIDVDPHSLEWVGGPDRLTTGPGPDRYAAISPDEMKLAFAAGTETTRAWSLPFDASTSRLLGEGEPVSRPGVATFALHLSDDATMLAYVAERGNRRELWYRSLNDGAERLLIETDSFLLAAPRWSHGGTQLSYGRSRPASPEARGAFGLLYRHSIFVIDIGEGIAHQLTEEHQFQGWPWDWTPDDRWILGSSARQFQDHWGLYFFPVDAAPEANTQARLLTERVDYDAFNARISPDGRWVCFVGISVTDAAAGDIYIVPLEGGEWRRVSFDGSVYHDKPRWAPDGRTIYFTSDRSGFFNVWAVRFDPDAGMPMGDAFPVTFFDSPSRILAARQVAMGIAVSADRLVIPITEANGSIWVLDNLLSVKQ